MTGGEGILGMWNRHPFHLIAWSTLAFLPFCFALISFLRPRREEDLREKGVDLRQKSESTVRPHSTQVPATRPPATRAPVSAKTASDDRRAAIRPAPAQNQQRTPAPATRPPAVIKPATPVSPKSQLRSADETESNQVQAPATRAPRAGENQQRPKHVETEQSLRPAMAPEKKTSAGSEFSALERRTPRPEDGKKK
jgi:hypothetical protein